MEPMRTLLILRAGNNAKTGCLMNQPVGSPIGLSHRATETDA